MTRFSHIAIVCSITSLLLSSSASAVVVAPERFWFTTEGVEVYIPYASTYPITQGTLPDIDRVIVGFHHGGRDALAIYEIIGTMVMDSGADDHILVITPQLLEPEQAQGHPQVVHGILVWEKDWFYNGVSANPDLPLTRSFDAVDSLIEAVVDVCPNLEVLILTGHAGGAKLANRHAMVSAMADNHQDIDVLYHFGNSGGYPYLTEERYDDGANMFLTPATGLDTTGCSQYDYWPFGLSNVPDPQLARDQYASRNVVMTIALRDTSLRAITCQMHMQTPDDSRLQMANLFWEHTQHVFGATPDHHLFFELPGIGHVVQDFYPHPITRHILLNFLQQHTVFSQSLDSPPLVPAEGGNLGIYIALGNSFWTDLPTEVWTEITLPGGTVVGPLFWESLNIPAGALFQSPNSFSQFIPPTAPGGIYTHTTKMGIYPDAIYGSHSFHFAKAPGAAAGDVSLSEWQLQFSDGEDYLITDNAAVATEFELYPVYPNPFNATATIRVNLPVASPLNVTVYNVLGEIVATLADEQFSAGSHTFSIDGSALSSGLYFVRAEAGGQWADIQKLMLSK